MASPGQRVRVATWNIHGCVGTDGERDPDRVAQVIRALDADLVGLQEVDGRRRGADADQLDRLRDQTGLTAVPGPARHEPDGYFGNALLTRHEVTEAERFDLSVPGREQRGVLDVRLAIGARPVRALVTHFGLRAAERRQQVEILVELIGEDRSTPTVLLGDFNEWRPRGLTIARLHDALGRAPRARSFPSRLPLLALDRIWVHPRAALRELRAVRAGASRVASDHLPVVAEIEL